MASFLSAEFSMVLLFSHFGEAKKGDTTLLSFFLLFKSMNKKLFDFACQNNGSYIWVAVAIINHESDCKPWLSAAQEVVHYDVN